MAEHRLPAGKEWIDNLVRLGEALGYQPEAEYDVAQDGELAPVDVAWLRSERDPFPLFIFEVESGPAGQMTQNAGKVFSQDSDLFEKPLFHFHILVRGGEGSSRVSVARKLFGQFNYRVYLAGDDSEATRVLRDVLSQHRRVSDRIEPIRLAQALLPDDWRGVDLDRVWRHAEECEFEAAWAAAYAHLSLTDETFLERFERQLLPELEGRQVDGAQYDTWLAFWYSPMIHLGLLAQLRPDLGGRCFDALQRWQSRSFMPMIGPQYGQSEDYDNFVFGYAGWLWALIAALMDDVSGARAWILEQMQLIIGEGRPIPVELSGHTGIWMLWVAAAGGSDSHPAFERVRQHFNAFGGVNPALTANPPVFGHAMGELDAWGEELRRDAAQVGDLESFRESVAERGGTLPQLVDLTLELLLADRYEDPEGRLAEWHSLTIGMA